MLERLPRGRRNLALSLLGLLGLWFAWRLRSVVNPLLLGYLFAFILHPLVQRIGSRGISRRNAVNLVFVLGGLLLFVLTLGLVVQTHVLVSDVASGEEVGRRIRTQIERAETFLRDTLDFEVDLGMADPARILSEEGLDAGGAGQAGRPAGDGIQALPPVFQHVRDYLREHEGTAQAAGRMGLQAVLLLWILVTGFVGWLVGVGGLLVLVPIYTYYLLFELERLHAFVKRYLPARDRERIAHIGAQMGAMLSSFFRGRLVVCLVKGVLITAGLFAVGVPYAFLLGMGSGFLSLIPFVGPMVGFVAAFAAGLTRFEGLLEVLVRTGIVFGVAELIEGYVLLPRILGDSLGLHPVVVLFSLLAGGAALGLFGVLIALPLTAAIVILVRELVLPALRKFADEEAPTAAGT